MRESWSFLSADGSTTISARWWLPSCEPKGVVQLVHGMVEFIDRYEPFACLLADAGYVVTGHDKLAHGDSVTCKEQWGHLPFGKGRGYLIGDIDSLRREADARFEGIPHILFGHSMGSFEVRSYISQYGQGLSGAMLCGTGCIPTATSLAGNLLSRVIGTLRGQDFRSKLLYRLSFGGYNKAFEPVRTLYDWISSDENVVDAYMNEPRNTFMFTAGGFENLTALTREIELAGTYESTPNELPLFIASGGKDPVGDFGSGPLAVAEKYRKHGSLDVTVNIYPNDRHEILNERDRELVMRDMLAWIDRRVEREA